MTRDHEYVLAYSVPLGEDIIPEVIEVTDSAHDVPSIWRTARGGIEALVSARQRWVHDGMDCRVDKIVLGTTELQSGHLLLVCRLTTTDDIFAHSHGFNLLAYPGHDSMRAFSLSADRVHALGVTDADEAHGALPAVRPLSSQEEETHLRPLVSLLESEPCVLVKFIRNDDTTAPCRFPPTLSSVDGLSGSLDCGFGSSLGSTSSRDGSLRPASEIPSESGGFTMPIPVVATEWTELDLPVFSPERILVTADQPVLVSDTEVIDLTRTDVDQVAHSPIMSARGEVGYSYLDDSLE